TIRAALGILVVEKVYHFSDGNANFRPQLRGRAKRFPRRGNGIMRFRLSPAWRFFSPEWRILIRRLTVPPLRRKPESPRNRREIFRRPPVPFLRRQESPPPRSGG
ncbi:MAG: hypothetical protein ACR2QC_03310, partial [Gammaproteobacteria bacterium]